MFLYLLALGTVPRFPMGMPGPNNIFDGKGTGHAHRRADLRNARHVLLLDRVVCRHPLPRADPERWANSDGLPPSRSKRKPYVLLLGSSITVVLYTTVILENFEY